MTWFIVDRPLNTFSVVEYIAALVLNRNRDQG
jgi:hypothetical protein